MIVGRRFVHRTTRLPGPRTDDSNRFVAEASAKARQADGCEGILILRDPDSGEGLAITMFRDQASADAFNALRAQLTTEAEQRFGGQIGEPQVYQVVVNL